MQERLQKIIARAGVASRRAGEEMILAGRVRVNGTIVTELGAKADLFADKIEVDGSRLVAEAPRYILLHKPRNVVSTLADPEGRPTVADLLSDVGGRVYPVGRLDFATSGVLLVTNDGEFANALLHPRGGVPKTYVLKVHGNMGDEDVIRWATGVDLDDGKTLPADVRILRHEDDKTWLEVTLREGRNQQIRRMGEATGFPVMRLARLSFAGISSEGVRPGEWRPLSVDELLDIKKHFGVPKKVRLASMTGPVEKPGRHGADRTNRGERPTRAAAHPERGGSPTQRGAPRPRASQAESGESRPNARPARPESGRARPETGRARSEPGRARPDSGRARPESGRTHSGTERSRPGSGRSRSEPGQGRPESGRARSESAHGRPESGRARPESGHSRPNTRASQPDTRASRPNTRASRPEAGDAAPTGRGNPRTRSAGPSKPRRS